MVFCFFIFNTFVITNLYYIIFRYLVVQLSTLDDNISDFKTNDRELQSTVLNTIKLLHGDFGAGAVQTCFKGINMHIILFSNSKETNAVNICYVLSLRH